MPRPNYYTKLGWSTEFPEFLTGEQQLWLGILAAVCLIYIYTHFSRMYTHIFLFTHFSFMNSQANNHYKYSIFFLS